MGKSSNGVPPTTEPPAVILTPFAIRVLRGELFVNGVQYEQLIDMDAHCYDVVTELCPSLELYRVLTLAFDAGRIAAHRAAAHAKGVA